MKYKVIIPAYNEGKAIANVIKNNYVSEIIVISNKSTDNTTQWLKNAGATVI
jgi:glycosyltransferase involved in cell wall biosynthesis